MIQLFHAHFSGSFSRVGKVFRSREAVCFASSFCFNTPPTVLSANGGTVTKLFYLVFVTYSKIGSRMPLLPLCEQFHSERYYRRLHA